MSAAFRKRHFETKKSRSARSSSIANTTASPNCNSDVNSHGSNNATQYRFYCQLAHGSPTGIITGFTTIKGLYRKIAECFELSENQIMFCTLNTHKIDPEHILSQEIAMDDFIFAHVRSQPKEICIRKDSESFGMTLSDSGSGVVFIKRLHPGGLMDLISDQCGRMIEIGDQIEQVNGISFVNRRHYDVAVYMQSIPTGSVFKLRLVSPEKSPIYTLNSRLERGGRLTDVNSGKQTIRLLPNGAVQQLVVHDAERLIFHRINYILGAYLGLEDAELASRLYEHAKQSRNLRQFSDSLKRETFEFYLPAQLISHIWLAVSQPRDYTVPNLSQCLPNVRMQQKI